MTHIPLITTTGRTNDNPGDTFIGVGLQYLFEQALGPQVWVLIDRFSPKGFRDYEDLVRNAPFLVYGGMPQYNNYDDWKHWYDDAMWRDFIVRWGLKIFTMAGGAGFSHPDIGVDAYAAYCMKSKKTERIIRQRVEPSLCFTVRDAYAHALLNALDIPNSYLPCAAVWASKMWNIAPAQQRPYLILVPPSPRHTPKRVERRRLPVVDDFNNSRRVGRVSTKYSSETVTMFGCSATPIGSTLPSAMQFRPKPYGFTETPTRYCDSMPPPIRLSPRGSMAACLPMASVGPGY